MKLKITHFACLLVSIALLLSACGGSSGGDSDEAEKTKDPAGNWDTMSWDESHWQ